MATFTDRDAALAVSCTICQADAGDPCCADDGKTLLPVHDARIDDLVRLIRQANDCYDREGVHP